jgi:hypothetical protein
MSDAVPSLFEEVARLQSLANERLSGRVRNLRLAVHGDGIILRGRAPTYYAKQLAQHVVMELTRLTVHANEIEVC